MRAVLCRSGADLHFVHPGEEGIDVNLRQSNSQLLCQSRADSHFVDLGGGGAENYAAHYLCAKHGVATSYSKKGVNPYCLVAHSRKKHL